MSGATVGRLSAEDVARLACPICHVGLTFVGSRADGLCADGIMRCTASPPHVFAVERGLPALYREADVHGSDRIMRVIYDGLPRLYDPISALLAPIARAPVGPLTGHPYIRRMELGGPWPPEGTPRPLRILDVGIGTGSDLPLIVAAVSPGIPLEIWGVDLSRGMIARCARRVARDQIAGVRLLLADAHALPFPDGSFDRVFHVGAINGYGDPALALAEMGRVAARGTPIVVVDEQLDPGRRHGLVARALFRVVSFHCPDPHCPVELLPPGAESVVREQASRFYYVMTYRMAAETLRER